MATMITPIDKWGGSHFLVAMPGPSTGSNAVAICAASADTASQRSRRMPKCQRRPGMSVIVEGFHSSTACAGI